MLGHRLPHLMALKEAVDPGFDFALCCFVEAGLDSATCRLTFKYSDF